MKKPEITGGEWRVEPSGNPHFDICVCTKKDGGSVCHVTNWREKSENAKAISAVPNAVDDYARIIHSIRECKTDGGAVILGDDLEGSIMETAKKMGFKL